MSCDIHLHIEVKVADVWHHWGNPLVHQWYPLFGKMAGVRDDSVIPITPPRGLPEDVTTLTMLDYSRDNPHHTSWFGGPEIVALENWLNTDAGGFSAGHDLEHHILSSYFFGNGFSGPYRNPGASSHRGVTDVRFVFWFDN